MKVDLTITTRKTADLIPYARNAKTHSPEQVAKIAGSIREFGFCNPVLIDSENGIIAGHGRLLAAGLLELEECPCIVLGHLSETQKKAYILADNRLAEVGSAWDIEMLRNELDDLATENISLDDIGFAGFLDDIPQENKTINEGELGETKHECPSCGHKW